MELGRSVNESKTSVAVVHQMMPGCVGEQSQCMQQSKAMAYGCIPGASWKETNQFKSGSQTRSVTLEQCIVLVSELNKHMPPQKWQLNAMAKYSTNEVGSNTKTDALCREPGKEMLGAE